MTHYHGILSLFCFAALLAAIDLPRASGQDRSEATPGQGIGLTQSFLLKDPAVQEALKLKPEQVEKANELTAEIVANNERASRQLRGLAAEERKGKRSETLTPLVEEATRKARAILSPDHFGRFLELDIQSQSLMSLTDPAIASQVGLTKDQSVTIREVAKEVQDASVKVLKSVGNGREVNLDRVAELRSEGLAKVVTSMTEDQKKPWNKPAGERFAPVPRVASA